MITKNNWFDCNVSDRVIDKDLDFKVTITPYDFKRMTVEQASVYAALEISRVYSKIYISFSGGLDSEYVIRLFHRLNINFKPIIVECGNKEETEIAYSVCKELNIIPMTILVEEKTLLDYYENVIFTKYNSTGINSTHMHFAAEYVNEVGGILLTGIHLNNDNSGHSNNSFAVTSEYDFHVDSEYKNVIHFFIYTMELTYALLQHSSCHENWDEYKNEIYGLNFREKIRPKYNTNIEEKVFCMSNNRKYNPNRYVYWTKNQIMKDMKCLKN
jgi:hypothetical protein